MSVPYSYRDQPLRPPGIVWPDMIPIVAQQTDPLAKTTNPSGDARARIGGGHYRSNQGRDRCDPNPQYRPAARLSPKLSHQLGGGTRAITPPHCQVCRWGSNERGIRDHIRKLDQDNPVRLMSGFRKYNDKGPPGLPRQDQGGRCRANLKIILHPSLPENPNSIAENPARATAIAERVLIRLTRTALLRVLSRS